MLNKGTFVNVLALLVLQMFGGILCVEGSDISGGAQSQYTQAECSELLQTMVFLSCKRDQPLEERMRQLDPYHNLLLQTWLTLKGREVMTISNGIGSASSFVLYDNHPEEYNEFTGAFEEAMRTYTEHQETEAWNQKRHAYWDELAEADLQFIKEHITDHTHSLAFICSTLIVIEWMSTSQPEREKLYQTLTTLFYEAKEDQLRRGLMRARFFFYRKHPEMLKQSIGDSDMHISQFCLYLLVEFGDASYWEDYVRQSWELYGKSVDEDKFVIPDETNVHLLLAHLIPDSGDLPSERSQLNWLKKHADSLVWDNEKHIYQVRAQDRLEKRQGGGSISGP